MITYKKKFDFYARDEELFSFVKNMLEVLEGDINPKFEVEIEGDILLTKGDYIIENMLKNFKVDIVNTQKKFFPEIFICCISMLVTSGFSINLIADKTFSLPLLSCLFFSAKYHLCIVARAVNAVKSYLHIKILPV